MKSTTPRRTVLLATLGSASIALAACGGGAAGDDQPDAAGSGLTEVSLVLDYLMDANKAPVVLGKEKGFFEERGIDLQIAEGTGSADSAKFVANGQYDFGFASATATMVAVSHGVPIVMVANHQPLYNDAILVREESGIDSIADLKGRSVAVGTNTTEQYLTPAVLAAAGLEEGDVELRLVNESAKTPLWLSGEVDGNANPLDGIPDMLQADPGLRVEAFPFAEAGFNIMNQGLIVARGTLEENADLVRDMVAAYAESYLYAAENRDEMIDVVSTQYPDVTETSLAQQYDLVFSVVDTEASADEPFGFTAPGDWENMIETLGVAEAIDIDTELPPAEYYTNEFIGDWEPLANLYTLNEAIDNMLEK
jgi:NitT/TauT family transport system substrate-binding protein